MLPSIQLLNIIDDRGVISLGVLRKQGKEEEDVQLSKTFVLPPGNCLVALRGSVLQSLPIGVVLPLAKHDRCHV